MGLEALCLVMLVGTLVCAIASIIGVALDLFPICRYWKFWYPIIFFLGFSLTLIATGISK